MTDRMRTQPFEILLDWVLAEYAREGSIFGIPRELFFSPRRDASYATRLFGEPLATPIGPAAGPHTQLAQNIVSAWLCGGRFLELKTVQVQDRLEIPRPCIDMEDEGYNVEWSQELPLEESLDEYVKAWALVHVLHRALGFEKEPLGTIFNMSVGYDLQGILSPPMQRFMDRLGDARQELAPIRRILARKGPRFEGLEIPDRIVSSVTLSTMHGCPPEEIEGIARYLIEERGLHTAVKLNPTLLGQQAVRSILHDELGYRSIDIPDHVFEKDLHYDRALALIRSLRCRAAERGVSFLVKLSNTLAMANHRGVLPGEEMYMSGRALYPVTMALFCRLREDLGEGLEVSYSAGADALNLPEILAAGALPVTIASDLLKPGGYGRLAHCLEHLEAEMGRRGAGDLAALAAGRGRYLQAAAEAARGEQRYRKAYHPHGLPKVASQLARFDCIEAPCIARCAILQDIPGYARRLARGDANDALAVVLDRNPLPAVTGYVCTHRCQTGCTRNVYDEPVAIRRLKRRAAEAGKLSLSVAAPTGRRVAVIGSGPSGLAASFFLARSGVCVTILEAKGRPGGMLALAPSFRLPASAVEADIERIRALGVRIHCDHPVRGAPEELLAEGYDAVYIGCGFARDARFALDGADAGGVYGALDFLDRVARGERPDLGDGVVVIGGGNTAMDAARTAARLTGRPSTVIYRRTRREMPAESEEVRDLLEEGNTLLELVSPSQIRAEDGRVIGIDCNRNRLGEPGADGRARPTPIGGSLFFLRATAVLVAIGQRPDTGFLRDSAVVQEGSRIRVDETSGRAALRIYAGGDIVRGPAIIVEACADGRRAAAAICAELGVPFWTGLPAEPTALAEEEIRRLKVARVRKVPTTSVVGLPIAARGGFDLVEAGLDEDAARSEAARCLECQKLCDRCVEVCPNRANLPIRVPTVNVRVPVLECTRGGVAAVGEEVVAIRQRRQILHIDDFCNECGNCTTFCAHDGRPYAAKPRLFLRREDYEAETENAFFLCRDALLGREGGVEARLLQDGDGFIYSTRGVRVRLSADGEFRGAEADGPFVGRIPVRSAVEMAVLFVGIRDSASYLPLGSRGDR